MGIPMPLEEVSRRRSRHDDLVVRAESVSKDFALVSAEDAWRLAFGGMHGVDIHNALVNVTISAPKGQFTGVLGLNGAGKTTLLRTLGGIYAPDSGVVTIGGALTAIYELGVAGNAFLSGRDYARRMLTLRGIFGAAQDAQIDDIVEFCELGERIDDQVQGYSTGMAARLYFAVATAGFYDVYLIDEVLSVGDQYFQAKCWRRIRDRLRRGASGILCTHDWSAVMRICTHALILEKGRVAFEGSPEKVARKYLYGDEMSAAQHEGVARIVSAPREAIVATPGLDLHVPIEIEILSPANVQAVAVIERLNVGTGWETMLMSRTPDTVGRAPGLHVLDVCVPALPLAAGAYTLSVSLVMPDATGAGRVLLDGFGWLSGDGVDLHVESSGTNTALTLPFEWTARAA